MIRRVYLSQLGFLVLLLLFAVATASAATPTISGISPASATKGTTVTVMITGTNFASGAEVMIYGSAGGQGARYLATGETVLSANTIRCALPIGGTAPTALYTVAVRNPGGAWVTKPGAFAVKAALRTPTVTGISPPSANRGTTLTLTITGTNFASGTEVLVGGGGTALYATGETLVNANTLRCTLAVPANAYVGLYAVAVRNPGGAWVERRGLFTVKAPAKPTVTGVSPISANRGTTLTVTVTGSNFETGTQVGFYRFGWVNATGETRINANTVRCTLSIPATARTGAYTVYVQNPGGAWALKNAAFTVLAPAAPTVTGISPASASRGSTVVTTVTGTNFVSGTEVAIALGGKTIDATGETLVNANTLRCTLTVPGNAYTGSYAVWVRNPGTSTWSYRANAFTVTTAPTPLVTSISPSTASRGSAITATVSGARFVPGAQVFLYGTFSGQLSKIEATGETVVNENTIRCTFVIPSTAWIGTYAIDVGNPGVSRHGFRGGVFTVTSQAAPTITGISPTAATRGTTVEAIVSGTNFASGAQVELTGGGTTIAATGETLLGATQIRCNVYVPSTASLGAYSVRVRNPTSVWVTKPGVFTVNALASPTITGISPTTATRGSTITATVTGTNFVSGTEVAVIGNGVYYYATGETLLSTSQMRCTLAIPSTASVGPYLLVVKNPGTTSWVSRSGAFSVVDGTVPTITGFSPSTIYRGSLVARTVSVSGTNFKPGAQVILTGGGQTVEAFGESVLYGTTISCQAFIPTNAYLGTWDVSVQNPGMTTWVSKTGAFTVKGTPTISGISPTSAARGSTVITTVTGTNFGPGIQAYLACSGTTIWATSVTPISANQFRCTFVIPAGATVGDYLLGMSATGMSYWVETAEGFFTVRG